MNNDFERRVLKDTTSFCIALSLFNTVPNNCVRENSRFGKILLCSVVKVSAFCAQVLGSNPALSLHFSCAFIHLFLCHGLCTSLFLQDFVNLRVTQLLIG